MIKKKILHVCLSNYYVDNFGYQENQLVRAHVEQGHIVKIVASCEILGADNKERYVEETEYQGSDGAHVKRIEYRFGNNLISRKIRAYKNFKSQLYEFKPEIIMFHGASSWELLTCAAYKKAHNGVKLYVDIHSDLNNSARGFISKNILHGLYYRLIVAKVIDVVDKFLCVSMDVIRFAAEIYKIPKDKIEFYPLGGNIIGDDLHDSLRTQFRLKYSIAMDEIVFGQFGKLSDSKKIIESMNAFAKTNSNSKYVIGGTIDEMISNEFFSILKADNRFLYIGWLSQEELKLALCGIDVYVQPGSQSAIMQNALCYGCALIISDIKSHNPYINGNGILVKSDVESLFKAINLLDQKMISEMKIKSKSVRLNFDYKTKLAERILE